MNCRDICKKLKEKKPKNMGRYAAGQKRCQICEIFMHVDGLFCPCCNMRLRTKPRNSLYKEKLRANTRLEP